MFRYFFEIAYHGKNYAGWQSQANAIGVQAVVESSLSKMLREEIKIVGSGRTDTGVHCEQQYFHVDIEKEFNEQNIIQKLNSFLPRDISILSIHSVKADASARFNAVERSYRYCITRKKNPFLEGLAWHYFKPTEVKTMNQAAALLRGEHDFECFSKVKTDVNHFLCTIKKAEWKEEHDTLEFNITANRFLRGMVRAIVATLLLVGREKISSADFEQIILAKDCTKADFAAPAHGLFLMNVRYSFLENCKQWS